MEDQKKRPTVAVGSAEETEEKVMTPSEMADAILPNENDFLQGLIDAENYVEDEIVKIDIARPVKDANGDPTGETRVFFSFRIKPLSEEEYTECRKKWTKYKKNRQFGVVMPEDTDTVKFRDQLIYKATVPEDRDNLWDNKKAWAAYEKKGHQIMSGLDIIEYSLKAGEKDRIVDMIDKISGYDDEVLEDVVKNS